MARTEEQNERIRVATRKKIMDAGLKLFAQKGFATTSIKDIAKTAGISTGLMYRHFSSKDELYCKLLEDTTMELKKTVEQLNTYNSPTKAFIDMTSGLLEDIESSEELSCYFLLICRSIFEGDAILEMREYRKSILDLYSKAGELIEEGQRLGEFKQGNPRKLVQLYFSVIQGMADMKLFMGDEYIAPEVDDIMTLLLK